MKLYVNSNWVRDMNTIGYTPLYTGDGEDTGAKVTICYIHGASPTEPMIHDLFGHSDHLPLTRVGKRHCGGMEITWKVHRGCTNYATFDTIPIETAEKTEWGIEEDDE